MSNMNKEQYDKQVNELFDKINELIEDAPVIIVSEISINMLEGCLLALPEDGQKMVAGGVMRMFKDVDEEMKRRKKLDS